MRKASFWSSCHRLSLASGLSVLGMVCVMPSGFCGAEMVLNYDVSAPGAWQEKGLKDSLGHGPEQMALPDLTVQEYEVLSKQEGFNPSITGIEEFGAPELVAKQGPGGRSYLSFQKLGGLSADLAAVSQAKTECTSGAFLNRDGQAAGYTMEMLVRIQPNYRATSSLALGGGGETSLENNFLGLFGNRSTTTTTVLQKDGEMPTNETRNQFQVTTALPFDDMVLGDWVHLVKVHDPASKTMTFYLDGQPIVEADLTTHPDLGEYPARQEYLTLIGAATRRVSGVDFSFLRVYRGAMSAEEVAKLYDASQKAL